MKTRLLILILFLGSISLSQAQVSINTEGNDPHESAMLDVSSTDKGLLIPSMNTADREAISNPANGLMVYDLDNSSFWFYSTATNQWEVMTGAIVSALNDLLDARTNGTSVFIGNLSGEHITGNSNVTLGVGAMRHHEESHANVAIGYFAGYTAEPSNASGNIFIGNEAGSGNTESHQLIIDNGATDTPLIHGDFLDDHLKVNGTLQITGGNPEEGKVLTTDNEGIASWVTIPAGVNELNELSDSRTGSNSLFLGEEAGISGNTEDYNTGIGQLSLKHNVLGEGNTAIGFGTLSFNETGSENTAIGSSSLASNTSGLNNTALGFTALAINNTGNDNVAIGSRALLMQTSGNKNTAIGTNAGQNAGQTSEGNIFIGYEAGKDEEGSNKLYIENSDSPTPLIGGDFETDEVKINGELIITEGLSSYEDINALSSVNINQNLNVSNNVTINNVLKVNDSAVINKNLSLNEQIRIMGGNPGEGKILVSDANGLASWQYSEASGVQEINDLEDAKTSNTNVFIGENSGQNNSGDNYNTALGQNSLMNNTSGFSNIAFGTSTLENSITGNNNTAIGTGALQQNLDGNHNTTIGSYSLYNNLGDYNTAIGYQAGQGSETYNTMGNVLIGYQAGYYETESSKLYIENTNSSTPLIGGDFNTDEVVINGTLAITGGNPGLGKVLVSDENGQASWEAANGAQSINDLSDAKTNGETLYIGNNAGENDMSNTYSTGLGQEALYNNTGQANHAFGYAALYSNTTGFDNAAFGKGALNGNTTGTRNVAFGNLALMQNQTGSNNTIIGNAAGGGTSDNISGSIFIGAGAGYSETESNKLHIENSTSEIPLIGGDFNTDYVDINGDLNISGSLKIEGGTPANGKVLTSDSEGNASWEINSAGASSIDDLSDAKKGNTSLFLGSTAPSDDGGNFNTATGVSALNSNVNGSANAAFGNSALLYSQTGNGNSAFGSNSMEFNTTGDRNTAIGSGALYFNSTGYNNTVLGYEAGYGSYGAHSYGNLFLGHKAGYSETGSNKLYIDNSDTYNPLIYGDFEEDKLKVNGEFSVNNDNIKVNNTTFETNVVISANEDIVLSDGKNLMYENTRTGKLQISGLDFVHTLAIDPYMTYADYGPGAITIKTMEEYLYFRLYAPIKLPQGVTIKKMTIGFASNIGTTIDMKIMKKLPMDIIGEGDELISANYTFNTVDLHSYSSDGLSGATIDNEYVYYMDIYGLMVKETGYYNTLFSLLTLTLEYEYTTLNY